MAASETAAWVAVDWGTSNLRAWMMGADGRPVTTASSDRGMATLQPEEFETALLDLIAPWLAPDRVTPVVCCGMVGARQGWVEAAYLETPCPPPDGTSATRVAATESRIAVHILPGLMQAAPPDVMRGEETQIAGFLAATPDFDGVLCLPGTHTKWARISAGEIVSFLSFMTGELFGLIAGQSVLRHSVSTEDFDHDAYLAAIGDALSRPQVLAAQLFGLRAGMLVADLTPATARARLSGLLIGVELAAARPYWLGQQIVIIGDSTVAGLYRAGLAAQGLEATMVDVTAMTLSGLTAAHRTIEEATP